MFETSVSPTAPLNLDMEYQNADLWGLWGGGVRTHPVHPPGYGPGRYTKEAPLLFIQYLTNKVRNSHLLLTFQLLSEVNEQRLFMWTDLRSLMSSVSMQNNLDQLVILCSRKKRLILVVSYSPPISFFQSPVSFQYVLRT